MEKHSKKRSSEATEQQVQHEIETLSTTIFALKQQVRLTRQQVEADLEEYLDGEME